MKKFLIIFALMFMFAMSITEAGHLEEISQRGTIKIGTTGDYRPMSYFNSETGEYEGIDAELSKIIADSLGVKIEYIPTTWPTLTKDTLDGKYNGNVRRLWRWNFRQNDSLSKERCKKIQDAC